MKSILQPPLVHYSSTSLWLSGPFRPLSLQGLPKGNACITLLTKLAVFISDSYLLLMWVSSRFLLVSPLPSTPELSTTTALSSGPSTSALNYYDGAFFFDINLFIYLFWLCWVFVAVHGLFLVAASGVYSLLQCTGFSLRWLLLLQSTGSRHTGFNGTWAQ